MQLEPRWRKLGPRCVSDLAFSTGVQLMSVHGTDPFGAEAQRGNDRLIHSATLRVLTAQAKAPSMRWCRLGDVSESSVIYDLCLVLGFTLLQL